MQYEFAGIVFTFSQDETGNVININSGNIAFVALFGSQGITFQPGVPVSVAQATVQAIVALL
jgi:hypothetical protein